MPEKAVQCLLNDLNRAPGEFDRTLLLQLCFYLFNLQDFASAIAVLTQGVKQFPEDEELWLNLAVCLSKKGRHQASIDAALKVIAISNTNFVAWDTLSSSYSQINAYDKASHAGTMALALKDDLHGKPDFHWLLPQQSRDDFVRHKMQVISFSLWGDNPVYLRGLLRNVLLGSDLFPDWQLRVYLDSSVPTEFTKLLNDLGVDVRVQPANQSLREKLCWRFKVANDLEVGLFLVRDADSVFSVREVRAVSEWLASDKWFHIIRDWWSHTDLILAGLWGGVAGCLPELSTLLQNYKSPVVETANIDQWFLRDKVWRYVKTNCVIHDRCFKHHNSSCIPGEVGTDAFHIGSNEKALSPKWQDQWLAPWIAQYPCLAIK